MTIRVYATPANLYDGYMNPEPAPLWTGAKFSELQAFLLSHETDARLTIQHPTGIRWAKNDEALRGWVIAKLLTEPA